MQTYVDLNSFLRKPLIMKGLDDREFIIPSSISTNFALKFSQYVQEQDKVRKQEIVKTDEETLMDMKTMILDIINLDKAHKYTLKDIEKSFDDMLIMGKVIEIVAQYLYEIENDPNSASHE